jgi:Uma2 family endonuclease
MSERRATYEDLRKVPAHRVAEIINGVLHTFPRPGTSHARAASHLFGQFYVGLGGGNGGLEGWVILNEPEIHFADDILVPDIAAWHTDRFPSGDRAFVEVAPDWICEVLSKSTAAIDRGEKLPIYARAGVPHVWLLDPQLRTLEVFLLDGASYRLVATHRDDAKIRTEPFGVELELSRVWPA